MYIRELSVFIGGKGCGSPNEPVAVGSLFSADNTIKHNGDSRKSDKE